MACRSSHSISMMKSSLAAGIAPPKVLTSRAASQHWRSSESHPTRRSGSDSYFSAKKIIERPRTTMNLTTAVSIVLFLLLSNGTLVGSIRTNDQTPADGRYSNSNACQVESGLDNIANAGGDVADHNRTINQANEDGRYDLNPPHAVDNVLQGREAADANAVDVEGNDDDEEVAVEDLGGLDPVPEHEEDYEEDALEELGRLNPAPEHEDDYERDAVEELGGLDPAPLHEDDREEGRRMNRNLTIDTVASNNESSRVTPQLSLLSPAPRLQKERKGLHDNLQGRDGDFCWRDAATSPSYGSGLTTEGRKYSIRIARKCARCNTEDSTAADLDSAFENEVGPGDAEQGGRLYEVDQDLGVPEHEVEEDLGVPEHEVDQEVEEDLGVPEHEVEEDLGVPDHEVEEDLGVPDHEVDQDLGGLGGPGAVAGDAMRPADVIAANVIPDGGTGDAQMNIDDDGRAVGHGGEIAGGVPPRPANNANGALGDDENHGNNGNDEDTDFGNGGGCLRWIIFILCPLVRPGSGRGKK